MLDSKDIYRDV